MAWEPPPEGPPPPPEGPPPPPDYGHPIRLSSTAGLERSRLTVFFRLLLVLPHLVWLVLWGAAVFLMAIANWLATLLSGTSPPSLHEFIARYIRYETHVVAYFSLTANPFPGFLGKPGSYPVEVEFAPPEAQNRWKTGFRLVLAIPALILNAALSGGSSGGGGRSGSGGGSAGLLWASAFLGWFAALFTGRMPEQLRDANLYALRYGAQAGGYLLLLTERYPDADPEAPPAPAELQPHPITVSAEEDLRRSRLTVFFRLLLAIPHFVWLFLWSIVALFAVIGSWFVTLFRGTAPDSLHRFLARFMRYTTHVYAYASLVTNPFPGFTGLEGYPLDVQFAPPERQNRWKTGFRVILVIPALIFSGGLSGVLFAVALFGWFTGLFVARMPRDLQRAGAYALRYSVQLNSYLFLLTDRYPDATPRING
jgi:hypothetical protein